MPIIAGFGMLTHTKSRRTNFEVVPDTKKGYLVMSNFNKPNGLVVILSVLVPLVGYILYFTKRDEQPDAAKGYLWAAFAGSITGLLVVL